MEQIKLCVCGVDIVFEPNLMRRAINVPISVR